MIRRIVLNIFIIILAFTLQVCVFPIIEVVGSWPNLLLIVVSICSFIDGKECGILYGLEAGLLLDLFYSGPFGFYTLFYINIGYLNGCFQKYYYEEYITLPLTLSVINELLLNLYVFIFRFLIHGKLDFGFYFLKIMLPEMIFTTLVTLFVYRALLWLNNAVRNFTPGMPSFIGRFRNNH